VTLPEAIFGLDRARTSSSASVPGSSPRSSRARIRPGPRRLARTGAKCTSRRAPARARHSSARPRSSAAGGKAHGPVARSHEHDLPKKVRALGLKHALSAKARSSSLIVVDELKLADAKTKALAASLAALGLTNALVIGGAEIDPGFKQAAAHSPNIDELPVHGSNDYDILRRGTLVLSKAAIEALEERFK